MPRNTKAKKKKKQVNLKQYHKYLGSVLRSIRDKKYYRLKNTKIRVDLQRFSSILATKKWKNKAELWTICENLCCSKKSNYLLVSELQKKSFMFSETSNGDKEAELNTSFQQSLNIRHQANIDINPNNEHQSDSSKPLQKRKSSG